MNLVIATTPLGGIGKNNQLPWKTPLQGDLPRFKQLTSNKTVVMGHNTWKSIGSKPLPNRNNVVISSTLKTPDAKVFKSIGEFLKEYFDYADVFLIGGANLVSQLTPYITQVYLTTSHTIHECDTFLNLEFLKPFQLLETHHFPDHQFSIYKKP